MLRDFLAYAERASAGELAPTVGARGGELPLVMSEMARRLRAQGLVVHEGYGHGEAPIDLAIEDPKKSGALRLAVESDGPQYAALATVRDRDRLRAEHLARLGWVHHRIWTADVFRDPARDVSAIVRLAHRRPAVPTPVEEETAVATPGESTLSGGAGSGGAVSGGAVSGGAVSGGEATDGEATDGEAAGKAAKSETTGGEVSGSQATDGRPANGDVGADGEATHGRAANGDVSAAGERTDGETTDGEASEGRASGGDSGAPGSEPGSAARVDAGSLTADSGQDERARLGTPDETPSAAS
jgi:hypothetical protein